MNYFDRITATAALEVKRKIELARETANQQLNYLVSCKQKEAAQEFYEFGELGQYSCSTEEELRSKLIFLKYPEEKIEEEVDKFLHWEQNTTFDFRINVKTQSLLILEDIANDLEKIATGNTNECKCKGKFSK